MVRATLKHGATTFTNYFVLLKSDGKWLIANKVYHGQRSGLRFDRSPNGRAPSAPKTP